MNALLYVVGVIGVLLLALLLILRRRRSPAPTQSLSLRLRNARPDIQTLYLEPWGDEHPMAPGAVFEIVARGPEGDHLEVEVGEGGMVVWGWSGSVASIQQDGVTLGPTLEKCIPVPATPLGSSTRGFLRAILGHSDDE